MCVVVVFGGVCLLSFGCVLWLSFRRVCLFGVFCYMSVCCSCVGVGLDVFACCHLCVFCCCLVGVCCCYLVVRLRFCWCSSDVC